MWAYFFGDIPEPITGSAKITPPPPCTRHPDSRTPNIAGARHCVACVLEWAAGLRAIEANGDTARQAFARLDELMATQPVEVKA